MTFEEVLKNDFDIRDGKIYIRNGSYTSFDVREFGWGRTEYQINGYGVYGEYSLKQDAYGDWYIHKWYDPIKKLKHLGGENWTTLL